MSYEKRLRFIEGSFDSRIFFSKGIHSYISNIDYSLVYVGNICFRHLRISQANLYVKLSDRKAIRLV